MFRSMSLHNMWPVCAIVHGILKVFLSERVYLMICHICYVKYFSNNSTFIIKLYVFFCFLV